MHTAASAPNPIKNRYSKIAFPVYPDMDDSIIKHLRIKSTPVTFLIDRETSLILAANHPINDRLEWSDLFFDYAVKLATQNKESYDARQQSTK